MTLPGVSWLCWAPQTHSVGGTGPRTVALAQSEQDNLTVQPQCPALQPAQHLQGVAGDTQLVCACPTELTREGCTGAQGREAEAEQDGAELGPGWHSSSPVQVAHRLG